MRLNLKGALASTLETLFDGSIELHFDCLVTYGARMNALTKNERNEVFTFLAERDAHLRVRWSDRPGTS